MSYIEIEDTGEIDALLPYLYQHLSRYPQRASRVRQVVVARYVNTEDCQVSCYSLNSEWKKSPYLLTFLIFRGNRCRLTLVPTLLPSIRSFRGWRWRECVISEQKEDKNLAELMSSLRV